MKKFLLSLITFSFLFGNICYGASSVVAVSATVLSKSNCKFDNTNAALNFGSLNPANTGDATAVASIDFKCGGSAPLATFAVSDDDGSNETGANANRMQHETVTTEYLPYSMTVSPTTGTIAKGATQTLTVTGTVHASDYQKAYFGNYTDTVRIFIAP